MKIVLVLIFLVSNYNAYSKTIYRSIYNFDIPETWEEFPKDKLNSVLYDIGITDRFDIGVYRKQPIFENNYPNPCGLFRYNFRQQQLNPDFNTIVQSIISELNLRNYRIIETNDCSSYLNIDNSNFLIKDFERKVIIIRDTLELLEGSVIMYNLTAIYAGKEGFFEMYFYDFDPTRIDEYLKPINSFSFNPGYTYDEIEPVKSFKRKILVFAILGLMIALFGILINKFRKRYHS
jgi:hypothetical protein